MAGRISVEVANQLPAGAEQSVKAQSLMVKCAFVAYLAVLSCDKNAYSSSELLVADWRVALGMQGSIAMGAS
jgi:hypothetical protein